MSDEEEVAEDLKDMGDYLNLLKAKSQEIAYLFTMLFSWESEQTEEEREKTQKDIEKKSVEKFMELAETVRNEQDSEENTMAIWMTACTMLLGCYLQDFPIEELNAYVKKSREDLTRFSPQYCW